MFVGYKVFSRFQESKDLSQMLRKVKTVCENGRIAEIPKGMAVAILACIHNEFEVNKNRKGRALRDSLMGEGEIASGS